MWLSGLLVVGSLLAVVVGDALVTQGQVRLADIQPSVATAVAEPRRRSRSRWPRRRLRRWWCSQAKSQGLVAAAQVVYLPEVPLNVPLPVPQTTPAPVAVRPRRHRPATTPHTARGPVLDGRSSRSRPRPGPAR